MEYKAEEVNYGSKCYDCTFSFSYTYDPAEPMVKYDANGGGYPGSPAEIEIYDIEVETVSYEEEEVLLTEKLNDFMLEWFNNSLEYIEESVMEQIEDNYVNGLSDN